MIVLVGVAHVINLRRQIEELIIREQADIVAVELDYGRYYALKNKVEGKMPYIYRKMSEMQKSVAEMLGTEVGDEMLTAVEVAQVLGKEIAFIDMDAQKIAEGIRKNMSAREKLKLYGSVILAPFSRKKLTKKEVDNIIENEEKYVGYIREKFPGLSKALFDDREEVMANNLSALDKRGKVIAFVGDAHLKGLHSRLPTAKIIKLRDLLGDSYNFSYSVVVN